MLASSVAYQSSSWVNLTITLRLCSSPSSITVTRPCYWSIQDVPTLTRESTRFSWQIGTRLQMSVGRRWQLGATVYCVVNKIRKFKFLMVIYACLLDPVTLDNSRSTLKTTFEPHYLNKITPAFVYWPDTIIGSSCFLDALCNNSSYGVNKK